MTDDHEVHFVDDSRPLRCARCNAVMGNAYVQRGRLLVADQTGHKLTPTRGADKLSAAEGVTQHFAGAANEHVHEVGITAANLQSDATREALEDASRAGIDRIRELESGSSELTYELRCASGHTPRIRADRLADAVRDAPGKDLQLG